MVDKEGLLVLKDGFSAFVLLWWADEYSAATAEAAVVEWASLFGVEKPKMVGKDGAPILKKIQKIQICAFSFSASNQSIST